MNSVGLTWEQVKQSELRGRAGRTLQAAGRTSGYSPLISRPLALGLGGDRGPGIVAVVLLLLQVVGQKGRSKMEDVWGLKTSGSYRLPSSLGSWGAVPLGPQGLAPAHLLPTRA